MKRGILVSLIGGLLLAGCAGNSNSKLIKHVRDYFDWAKDLTADDIEYARYNFDGGSIQPCYVNTLYYSYSKSYFDKLISWLNGVATEKSKQNYYGGSGSDLMIVLKNGERVYVNANNGQLYVGSYSIVLKNIYPRPSRDESILRYRIDGTISDTTFINTEDSTQVIFNSFQNVEFEVWPENESYTDSEIKYYTGIWGHIDLDHSVDRLNVYSARRLSLSNDSDSYQVMCKVTSEYDFSSLFE